jgi:hypothetical protein
MLIMSSNRIIYCENCRMSYGETVGGKHGTEEKPDEL